MPHRAPFRRKVLPASPTIVQSPLPMRLHMLLQTIRPYKCLLAHITLKRPNARMTPYVHHQHIPIHELLLAKRAFMLLLLAVNPPQMIAQISVTLERLRAYLTHMLLVRMGRHVNVDRRRRPPRIIAQFTRIQPFVAVRLQMHVHRCLRRESLAAGVANVVANVRVHGDDVLLKSGTRGEAMRALGAHVPVGVLN